MSLKKIGTPKKNAGNINHALAKTNFHDTIGI
ncbi:MAG: hypothetical protein BWX61_01129 [Bacteroidetes bacterium ADurb.Bin035]|nr:MAG: hypothetical protein BWX61_01129 [Bacteroidetes bacterium ADurb.Bin035]